MKLKLFRFNYWITGGHARDYLGASLSAKHPRDGEDWIRGSDLADGKFNIGTIVRIIRDILRCEITGSKYKSKS